MIFPYTKLYSTLDLNTWDTFSEKSQEHLQVISPIKTY